MKANRATFAALAILTLACGAADAQVKPRSSTKQFRYKAGKIETGMLYSYVRSDLAGTKSGSVLVYVPDRKRVEILRVNPGSREGQLLTGEMNWDTFALRRFELWREGKDGGKSRVATGDFSDEDFSMSVEDPSLYRGAPGAASFRIPLTQLPTHIYSLDFITLGLALRHFADPSGSVAVGVLTENPKVSPESPNFLVSAGTVAIAFVEDVNRDGTSCAKYRVAGPALGAGEGFIWMHKEKGHVQDAEIPAPTGPDWPDVKITLRSAEKVPERDWPLRRSLEIAGAK